LKPEFRYSLESQCKILLQAVGNNTRKKKN